MAVGFAGTLLAVAATPPNVIVILADDLGYGDLGIQGSTTIATPRIDRMAREGLRFTAAYAAAPARCSRVAGMSMASRRRRSAVPGR
jgi:arylsulfatase A-like enzyme